MLSVCSNGTYLSVDITAHMEYFYNTLNCDNQTENPFRQPNKFQALLYPVGHRGSPSTFTRLELHHQVIFPQLASCEKLKEQTMSHLKSSAATMETEKGMFSPLP